MIDYKELFEKSKELSIKHNLTQLELYQRFMFERILERISVSKYRNNFILKGGLLLSAMFGIDSRTTKDMDVTIKGIDVSKEKMIKILNEILVIDLKDRVKFKDDIDIDNLKLSIKRTFENRMSFEYLRDFKQILDGVFSDERMVKLWNGYTRKNKYATGIKFEVIVEEVKRFIVNLDLEDREYLIMK